MSGLCGGALTAFPASSASSSANERTPQGGASILGWPPRPGFQGRSPWFPAVSPQSPREKTRLSPFHRGTTGKMQPQREPKISAKTYPAGLVAEKRRCSPGGRSGGRAGRREKKRREDAATERRQDFRPKSYPAELVAEKRRRIRREKKSREDVACTTCVQDWSSAHYNPQISPAARAKRRATRARRYAARNRVVHTSPRGRNERVQWQKLPPD